ncbi:MAG: glycosyltransferase, partial [Holophagales bacterium]|nr:glycosyltransferase [Holophagales bacterium]
SLTETFGNVILEGMASGLAVLAFDYAAAGSLITHGSDGFTPPFADEEAWLAQARAIAALPVEQVRTAGRRARQKAEGETWGAVVGRLEAHLRAADGESTGAQQGAAG